MSISVSRTQIGAESECVEITVSGKYNPDILDDVKNRALEAWNEAFVVGDLEPPEVGDVELVEAEDE